uniref:Uncharacterized protein n=1 Tax=Sphaerodactylus townsendi TaxID=933632 RepID=A0ACB8G0C5_9SAUR
MQRTTFLSGQYCTFHKLMGRILNFTIKTNSTRSAVFLKECASSIVPFPSEKFKTVFGMVSLGYFVICSVKQKVQQQLKDEQINKSHRYRFCQPFRHHLTCFSSSATD